MSGFVDISPSPVAIGPSSKTVLMMGAGASAASDFHLPTMAGFFSGDEPLPEPLGEFLDWFYPDRARSEYNLEEVMAFLDISRARLQLWGIDRPEIRRFPKGDLYRQLLAYVKLRLSIPDGPACQLHSDLVRTLRPEDTIISLNYDVIVERSLAAIEPPRNLPPGKENRLSKLPALIGNVPRMMPPTPGLIGVEREDGFYLKLHGSLDWLYCPTPGCINHVNLYPLEALGRESQGEGEPCRYCGAALEIFIVPPVATKRLEDRGRMAFLWNLAYRELQAADELVIIGLSFAASDFELRWLLRQALLGRNGGPLRISIVNRQESHADSIYRFLPNGYDRGRWFETLREYVDTFAGKPERHA